tara:strand:+ start:225 stop:644 length:420 start_codon:yes stop_codon:yes gene_type:complete
MQPGEILLLSAAIISLIRLHTEGRTEGVYLLWLFNLKERDMNIIQAIHEGVATNEQLASFVDYPNNTISDALLIPNWLNNTDDALLLFRKYCADCSIILSYSGTTWCVEIPHKDIEIRNKSLPKAIVLAVAQIEEEAEK